MTAFRYFVFAMLSSGSGRFEARAVPPVGYRRTSSRSARSRVAHGKAGRGLQGRRWSLLATSYRQVDVTDTASVEEATQWWEELTGRGGEGVVVKPLDFIVRGRRGLTQPAVKCRGPEYLRIIAASQSLHDALVRECRLGGRP